MRVKFKEDDLRFKISKGDIFLAKPYWLDPSDKVTLICRESDGYDPSCNAYRNQVEILPEAPHD